MKIKFSLLSVGLALALLALGLGALLAQEEYTYTLTGSSADPTTNVGKVELGRQQQNRDICTRYNLAYPCTQGDACVAAGVASGQACTSTEAINADCRIFPDSLIGRQSFQKEILVKKQMDVFEARQISLDQAAFQNWCKTATREQQDVICSTAGLAAGCRICN